MLRAHELTLSWVGRTSPNPPVGCVLLTSDGATLAEGWHEGPGTPHAEAMALQRAGGAARGATAVVTLEPCTHTGRTPPCAQALIAAGVQRVIFALHDPTLNARGGAQQLREHGVHVIGGVEAETVAAALGPWHHAVQHRRPFVTWKYAATLDGRIAAEDGTSRWISSKTSRHRVHQLRSQVDAVMVGVGTVLADDPALTVRLDGYTGRQPLRVVYDTHQRTPRTARVLSDDAAPTRIFSAEDTELDVRGCISVPAVLSELYDSGVRWVLLEGGPTLAGAALRENCVDEVVAYIAPALLGAGPAAVADAGVHTMAEKIAMSVIHVKPSGEDTQITLRPQYARNR